jgi:membrane protein
VEVPRVVLPGKGIGWKEFFKLLREESNRDRISDTAAALTFFGVLAIFPFLIFLVSLASLIIDPQQAQLLIDQLGKVAPAAVTQIVGERLHALVSGPSSGLLTVSALGAIWAASGGIAALMRALNLAYDVDESRPFWKVRLIAVGATIAAAAISVIATLLAVGAPALADRIGGPVAAAILWLRLPVAGLLMMFVWALLYYFLPDVQQRFKLITPGSVIGVVVWMVASWGFSFYVSHFGSYDVTYGTLGGFVVLLFWMWISAQVVMLGAEVNAILEHRSPEGKKVGQRRLDDPGVSETKGERIRREEGRPPPAEPPPSQPVH